jgi:hypothetical protein
VNRYGGNNSDDNGREFTIGKSYVFSAGIMTFSRAWDTEPTTMRGKIAFVRYLVR